MEGDRMKWEYKAIIPENDFVPESLMNELGQEGWELVYVDNGIAYFKRPIVDHAKLSSDVFEGKMQKALSKYQR